MKDSKFDENELEMRSLHDDLFKYLIILFTAIAISPVILIIYKLIVNGYKQFNLSFITETTPDSYDAMLAVSSNSVIPGGILNGISGTLYMLLIASIIAIPIGISIGIFLYENRNKTYTNIIRNMCDILQGMPSIVIGLISYFWVVKFITHGFSALAGAVAMSIMMLPLIIRSTEETFKMMPDTIKEAGFALGVPYHKVVLKILIPSSLSGLLSGVLLAISRVIGETALLMFTALGSMSINFNFAKPTSAIPLLIWEFYNDPNMVDLIWASSLLLMLIVLTLNLISNYFISKNTIQ